MGTEWVGPVGALLGALLGALVGYLGAVRGARRAASAAWAANTMTVARALLESDDPAQRALGDRLLAAAVGAIADAEDTPDRIKEATRGPDLSPVVDSLRTVDDEDLVVEIDEDEEDRRGEGRAGHP